VNVLARGDRFKVFRVHAGPIATEVVDLEPWRDGANERLVESAMGSGAGPVVSHEERVATAGESSPPHPTSVWAVEVDPLKRFPGSLREVVVPNEPLRLTSYRPLVALSFLGDRSRETAAALAKLCAEVLDRLSAHATSLRE